VQRVVLGGGLTPMDLQVKVEVKTTLFKSQSQNNFIHLREQFQ
jgi:hypothetical protein